MIREVDLFGVFVSPFARDLVLAALGFLLLRLVLARRKSLGLLTNHVLFELSLMILSLLTVAYSL
jgi:hypothetical protein